MTGRARPLCIGICAPYDLGREGGVNSHIRAQATALRRLGHSVVIFGASSAPLGDGEIAIGGSLSIVIGGTATGFGLDPRAWRQVIDLFRAHRFDVVHVHEPLMPLVPWLAVRHSPAPIVATFHVHREQGHVWYPKFKWLLAPLMRRVDARLAVSAAARRTVAHTFPGEYDIVPNGIDVARFQLPAARPREMGGDVPSVLFVGRLEPRKGVGRLIQAMTIVQRRVPNARLMIVGDGPDRAALEAAARDAQVTATFTGRVADEALPAFYRAADLVCSPALGGESFGIVLLEAMAAGRPIVATRIEGYEELLSGAECARLVTAGDSEALADAIATLLGDAGARRALGANGEAFVRDYDWALVARRLESIYVALVSQAGLKGPPYIGERDAVQPM